MVKFIENAATVGGLRTLVRALGRMAVPDEATVAHRREGGELHLEIEFVEEDPAGPTSDDNEEDD